METLRERTVSMLQGGHITSFVYVDDKFGNTLVDKAESKIYVGQHIAEVGIINNPEIWEDQFEEWWKETPEDERQKTCQSWGLKADNADTLKELLNDDLIPSLKLMLSDIESALERTKPILKSAESLSTPGPTNSITLFFT